MSYKKCKVCKKIFYARPDKPNRGKYCSRNCYKKDLSRLIVFNCEQCGKKVERPKWRMTTKPMKHRFCSLKCYSRHRSLHREEYPNYYKPKRIWAATTLTENTLRDEYINKRMRILDIAEKHETSYSLVQKRLKKFGISESRGRYSLNKSEAFWSRTMNKSLNHTCQICGWNKANCDIHHKIGRSNGGKWEKDNLILVCPNCHRLLHKNKSKLPGV
jgi:hypothetical protein